MATKRWTVIYCNHATGQKISATVFAVTLEQAKQQAKANAEDVGCKDWLIETVTASSFVFPSGEEMDVLDEFKKAQRDGATRMCPRCGQCRMDERPARNALSRAADIQICDACGMDEAIRAYTGEELPIREWAIVAMQVKNQT